MNLRNSIFVKFVTRQCLVNGGLDSGGSGKYSENLINGGPHKRVRVRLGNPYLNIRHKIMLYMPIPAYT